MIRSLSTLQYMVCHNDRWSKNHEEYERMTKELTNDSLGGVIVGQGSISNPQPKSTRATQRVTRLLKCSPIKEDDANVMIEVSDGDDDIAMLQSNPSDSGESNQSDTAHMTPSVESTERIGMSWDKGKLKVNTQVASIPKGKPLSPAGRSIFKRPFARQVVGCNWVSSLTIWAFTFFSGYAQPTYFEPTAFSFRRIGLSYPWI